MKAYCSGESINLISETASDAEALQMFETAARKKGIYVAGSSASLGPDDTFKKTLIIDIEER